MSKDSERLIALAEKAEHEAAAYRLAAAALNGHAVDKRAARQEQIMRGALASEAASRNGHAPAETRKSKRASPGSRTAEKLAARARTVAILDALDTSKPRTTADVRAALGGARIAWGPLAHSGYIRKKRGGWIRTAKPYNPTAVNHP